MPEPEDQPQDAPPGYTPPTPPKPGPPVEAADQRAYWAHLLWRMRYDEVSRIRRQMAATVSDLARSQLQEALAVAEKDAAEAERDYFRVMQTLSNARPTGLSDAARTEIANINTASRERIAEIGAGARVQTQGMGDATRVLIETMEQAGLDRRSAENVAGLLERAGITLQGRHEQTQSAFLIAAYKALQSAQDAENRLALQEYSRGTQAWQARAADAANRFNAALRLVQERPPMVTTSGGSYLLGFEPGGAVSTFRSIAGKPFDPGMYRVEPGRFERDVLSLANQIATQLNPFQVADMMTPSAVNARLGYDPEARNAATSALGHLLLEAIEAQRSTVGVTADIVGRTTGAYPTVPDVSPLPGEEEPEPEPEAAGGTFGAGAGVGLSVPSSWRRR